MRKHGVSSVDGRLHAVHDVTQYCAAIPAAGKNLSRRSAYTEQHECAT
ncbi:hypothetical protein LMG29739_01023 [Paraburkholderia solisilvae]|uniref:Uncharacterized protein n=1 Tax=Paraburkholderia solisilvae TaxID=624376 RepID=A0A6J5DAX3_9BURK|nr:hypothetical protein LMG29739_01023 [Paraburkholderia solisilvae]